MEEDAAAAAAAAETEDEVSEEEEDEASEEEDETSEEQDESIDEDDAAAAATLAASAVSALSTRAGVGSKADDSCSVHRPELLESPATKRRRIFKASYNTNVARIRERYLKGNTARRQLHPVVVGDLTVVQVQPSRGSCRML